MSWLSARPDAGTSIAAGRRLASEFTVYLPDVLKFFGQR